MENGDSKKKEPLTESTDMFTVGRRNEIQERQEMMILVSHAKNIPMSLSHSNICFFFMMF